MSFRPLATAIIAGGGLDTRMPGQFLHSAHVRTRIEQIANKRPPAIMWREMGNSFETKLESLLIRHNENLAVPAPMDVGAAS